MISPYWRQVRARMHEIAVELYMLEHRHTCVYNTPEDKELKEGGYLERAKVLALREMNLKAQKTQTLKEAKDNGL